MNYKIVPVELVESALDDLPPGTSLVIGSPDGVRAVEAAAKVTSNRSAVFVGNLASGEDSLAADQAALSSSTSTTAPAEDSLAAEEMAVELFAGAPVNGVLGQ